MNGAAFIYCCPPSHTHWRSYGYGATLFVFIENKKWWWGEDSNLRRLSQQSYSLPRLTASVPHHSQKENAYHSRKSVVVHTDSKNFDRRDIFHIEVTKRVKGR